MQALGKEIQNVFRAGRKKEQSNEELSAISGARLLLVEDNEINQQVAQEILQGAGLIVTVVNNGQEGVDAARQNQYDAILMDIQMPVMDGYTATREIRNLKSEIRNVPILAMTAHAMAGDEQKSLDAGMNGHVTKPIDPAQLFAALQKWIKPGDKPIEGQQAQASIQPDQTEPNEAALPESLPGFDIDAGLKRLLGNKHLYRKLLVDFGTKYTETAGEIGAALDAKDFERVHSLVHNLKGLAGNLEAKDLQAATVEMEKLVKGQTENTASDKELIQKFAALENALQQALNAVQTLGPAAEKKTIENSADARASVPPELVNKAAESIKAAAEMGDVAQIKSIAEELKSESEAMAPFCDELVRLAQDFDFDGIQRFMREFGS